METLQQQARKLAENTAALSKVGLLVVEDNGNREAIFSETSEIYSDLGYYPCADYLEIMDALSSGQNRIFYIEQGEKLNGLVLEIAAEFETGIVSLADRKKQTGLKTAKWNPVETSFIIVMTRLQVEKSHPRLFEYINIIQSA